MPIPISVAVDPRRDRQQRDRRNENPQIAVDHPSAPTPELKRETRSEQSGQYTANLWENVLFIRSFGKKNRVHSGEAADCGRG